HDDHREQEQARQDPEETEAKGGLPGQCGHRPCALTNDHSQQWNDDAESQQHPDEWMTGFHQGFGLFNSDESFSFAFAKSTGLASGPAGVLASAAVGAPDSDPARSGRASEASFAWLT